MSARIKSSSTIKHHHGRFEDSKEIQIKQIKSKTNYRVVTSSRPRGPVCVPHLKKYKGVLAAFMPFIHGHSEENMYDRNFVHAVEVLAAATPEDVVRYTNMKMLDTDSPPARPDENPVGRRGNTLGFDKKAISFLMSN
jgi:hypothetical protein